MESITGDVGSKIVIDRNGFARSGYTFTGWNTQADGKGTAYKPGDSFMLTDEDTVLYAQWSENAPAQINVSYDANGGTGPSIYAQQGKCRNHAAFSTLKTIKQPL